MCSYEDRLGPMRVIGTEKKKKKLSQARETKKVTRSEEHKTKGQKIFSEETGRTRRDGRENRRVIIIIRCMTTTKPQPN